MSKKSAARSASPHLIVSRPITLLHREVKSGAFNLFKNLGIGIAHFKTGKYVDLLQDLGKVATALKLKPDPSGLVWHLIKRALFSAMRDLASEAWLNRPDGAPEPAKELADQLDNEVENSMLEVDSSFFRNPGNLPFLNPCKAWFEHWLIGSGFSQPQAVSISRRLPTYFVYALSQAWRVDVDLYSPIIIAATTPFTQAGERERAWEDYRAWLDHELDSPMFGEPFSLKQLYVPLRAYYERQPKDGDNCATDGRDGKDKKRIAVDLSKHLLDWVQKTDSSDAVRIISGGPGSGKSSMAKMFTAEALATTSWRVLYLPLHRIKYTGEIIPAIQDYLHRSQLLPGHPAPLGKDGDPRLLLIFDGLDELAMLGKMAQETANQFVRTIKELVRDINTTGHRMKVILTGRTVIMQSLEAEFRKESAILHLCPYHIEKSEEKKYERGWNLLHANDQRQQWWRTYGELTGQGYKGLPAQFNRQDLIEVSSEPLLNYLLALANQANTLDFTQKVTQNQIYASLIRELHQRRWAEGENFAVKGMTEDRFHRVLEEIAIAAWHGDGRKTTVGEIKQHCQDAGITKMLEIFQDGAEQGVLRLLTAFFFRQAGAREDENAFEFTHKSFGEYLVACRVVRMIEIIEKKTKEQEAEFTGWDSRKSLEEWARLCGPSAMTERQWEFLKNEMHMPRASPSDWQDLIVALINTLLRQGMPLEKLGLKSFQHMRLQSRNAEEALLLALNACSEVTEKISRLNFPELTSAGAWIKQLQGQREGDSNVLAMGALKRIRMANQSLYIADLYNANLSRGDFTGAGFTFCVANRASFYAATLAEADLQRVNLQGANFEKANLKRANLEGANLQRANLEEANLEEANLEGANLKGANLKGAHLEVAHLKEAHLKGAHLEGTNLKGANLERANLEGAHLKGANLERANLEEAKFEGSKGRFKS